jgi:hypothetical protein
MAAAKESFWFRNLSGLIGFAAFGFFIYDMARRDKEQARQQHEADLAMEASRQAVFARGDLAEMLKLCSEGWQSRMSFYYTPVAIAWTRTAVDAYFLSGTDVASVRQVKCDAKGVEPGPRVEFPIEEKMPAEAAQERDADEAQGEWQAAINRTSTGKFDAGEVAVELLRHPFTGQAISRRWRGGPEGASAALDPPDAAPFAFLPASTKFPVVGKAPPALRPLERKRWITQSAEAFALLAREMPKGAHISELTLEEDEIKVQIAATTPAFDGRPPVPYGDKSFDEYGVADAGYWYPREIPGFGCVRGTTLANVMAAFALAKNARGPYPITTAWYSCSTAYSNGLTGSWHFMPSTSQ